MAAKAREARTLAYGVAGSRLIARDWDEITSWRVDAEGSYANCGESAPAYSRRRRGLGAPGASPFDRWPAQAARPDRASFAESEKERREWRSKAPNSAT